MIIGFGQEGQQYCRTGGQFFMYHRVVKCFGVDTFSQTHAEDRHGLSYNVEKTDFIHLGRLF